MNDKLMMKIGMDKDGSIPEGNFVEYFAGVLSQDDVAFELTMEQFMSCAKNCRGLKVNKRKSGNRQSPRISKNKAELTSLELRLEKQMNGL